MSNNDQVTHRWAQFPHQRKKTGKCGNVRYDEHALFSYWAEIGRFTGETAKNGQQIVLISHNKYSHTTSQHQNGASSASRHQFQIFVGGWTSSYCHNWREAVIREYLAEISATIDALKQSRKPVDLVSCIAGYAQKICRIIDNCGARLPKQKKFSIMAIRKLAGSEQERETYLRRNVDASLPERLTKHRQRIARQAELTETRRAARRAQWEAQHRAWEAGAPERERLKQEQEEKNRRDFESWKRGELEHRTFYGMPMTLRVRGENIETSHGASVPVDQALQLYQRIITLPSTIAGFQIGDFQVRDLIGTNGDRMLRVGCHDIPMSEVERIYRELQQ